MRLRRNCSSEEDYLSQSQVLALRFQQKGYEKGIERVRILDRQSIITGTQSRSDAMNGKYRMIVNYSVQHR